VAGPVSVVFRSEKVKGHKLETGQNTVVIGTDVMTRQPCIMITFSVLPTCLVMVYIYIYIYIYYIYYLYIYTGDLSRVYPAFALCQLGSAPATLMRINSMDNGIYIYI